MSFFEAARFVLFNMFWTASSFFDFIFCNFQQKICDNYFLRLNFNYKYQGPEAASSAPFSTIYACCCCFFSNQQFAWILDSFNDVTRNYILILLIEFLHKIQNVEWIWRKILIFLLIFFPKQFKGKTNKHPTVTVSQSAYYELFWQPASLSNL